MAKHILIVDDEPRMRRFVRMNLELEGFRVSEASDGLEAVRKVREDMPNLVVLDVEMPYLDGFETLAEIRRASPVPVIMLTVRSEEDERIKGLDLGADDYVTKPFSARELVSRINAVLRRVDLSSTTERSNRIEVDDRLVVDFDRRQVLVQGELVKLRPTEYRLLYHFIQNPGRMLTHEQLLSMVWDPRYIFNERGVGYRFVDFKRS